MDKENQVSISMCHGCGNIPENGFPKGWGFLRLPDKQEFEFDLCPDCIVELEYGRGMPGSIFELIKIID